MFVDSKKLTKVMKKSYKGIGLFLGFKDGNLLISNGFIAVSQESGRADNVLKAAFVEYLGFIPEDDCYFYIQKDIKNPQGRMTEVDEIVNLLEKYWDAEIKAFPTPIDYRGLRLYQSGHGNIFGLDPEYLQVIDKSLIEYGEESEPTGPCYIQNPMGGIYWHNDYCTLVILPVVVGDEKLLDVLNQLEYYKKDSEKDAAEAE
jgi:hypothetical protein